MEGFCCWWIFKISNDHSSTQSKNCIYYQLSGPSSFSSSITTTSSTSAPTKQLYSESVMYKPQTSKRVYVIDTD